MRLVRLAVVGVAVTPLLLHPAARSADTPPACDAVFTDDFSQFPPGVLSQPVGTLNGAIQEYHYLPHRGVPLGPWANAICHLDAWVAGDEDGLPYMEQHLTKAHPQWGIPLFVTGDPEWGDYTVEARVRPLAVDGFAGLAFRYKTNRDYYFFALTGGNEARLAVRLPLEKEFRKHEWRELARAPLAYDTKTYYRLTVVGEGPRIRAFVDGKPVVEATDGERLTGKVALVAAVPARFQAFKVSMCPPARAATDHRIAHREAELARLRAANPRPRLWKKFATKGFGAGRNARFGDLDGDGALDMLIAQNIPRVRGDAFDHISALTAVTLDGKVLWQSGRPDPRNGLLTNDTPFQIHDVDGDGASDVVLIRDFKLQVLDGGTGAVKRWTWMPPIPADAPARPYELYSGDSIVFAALTGPERRDILLKDRYRSFWAFSRDLRPLWQGSDDTGHYPYPFDVDGDGRDELFIGHSLWDHAGQRQWTLAGKLGDHVDALSVGNFSADPKAPPRVYWSSSDEAFVMLDLQGQILKQVRVGHTQTAAVGKFRDDVPGLQYVTTNFWRNPGIMSLFDSDGNLLEQAEPIHTGSVTLPVNWRGDGQELVLLSGNVREGGMIDGRFRRVVMFPDDGHPDLTAAVLDLTGDPRDEVVLWDEDEVWIYTQDGPPPPGRVYAPVRNPHYNDSNYRAHVSLPGWTDGRAPFSAAAPARH
jgi:rhamnogalacturonan endolyase